MNREMPRHRIRTGYDGVMADTETPISLLAVDHRASLAKDVYGLSGPVSAADARRIADGKELVYAALDPGTAGVGVLVDERYGASVARAARTAGIVLAMPIEKSGEALFTPE